MDSSQGHGYGGLPLQSQTPVTSPIRTKALSQGHGYRGQMHTTALPPPRPTISKSRRCDAKKSGTTPRRSGFSQLLEQDGLLDLLKAQLLLCKDEWDYVCK